MLLLRLSVSMYKKKESSEGNILYICFSTKSHLNKQDRRLALILSTYRESS